MSSWHSYPSIYALGHAAVADLLLDPVIVEEKIDGSQFNFGMIPNDAGQVELKMKSKGADCDPSLPSSQMFKQAMEWVASKKDDLRIGWTYRAEYLAKPKHNVLAYDRAPASSLILFDINAEHEEYVSHADKATEAARLGLECVPVLFEGMVTGPGQVVGFLDRVSVLGGQKLEGVVLKNYRRFGKDKKALMGKYVSEAFKEVHKAEWKDAKPGQGAIVETLVRELRTPARWHKAVQHKREAGALEGSPRDIGPLLEELGRDILKECEADIKERLFRWAWKEIARGVSRGFPQWYKEELLKKQFEKDDG